MEERQSTAPTPERGGKVIAMGEYVARRLAQLDLNPIMSPFTLIEDDQIIRISNQFAAESRRTNPDATVTTRELLVSDSELETEILKHGNGDTTIVKL
ncbi:MAG: hypothetical protein JWO07_111 [Candidatus Saccharibacteria bacterium]|nr:hypothetical protein [Candidatus Saccharibacteria bacterium]